MKFFGRRGKIIASFCYPAFTKKRIFNHWAFLPISVTWGRLKPSQTDGGHPMSGLKLPFAVMMDCKDSKHSSLERFWCFKTVLRASCFLEDDQGDARLFFGNAEYQMYSQNILIILWFEVSLVAEQIHSSQSSFNWFPSWNGNYFTTGKTWDIYSTKMQVFYLH